MSRNDNKNTSEKMHDENNNKKNTQMKMHMNLKMNMKIEIKMKIKMMDDEWMVMVIMSSGVLFFSLNLELCIHDNVTEMVAIPQKMWSEL